jgi:hypothetical protein
LNFSGPEFVFAKYKRFSDSYFSFKNYLGKGLE